MCAGQSLRYMCGAKLALYDERCAGVFICQPLQPSQPRQHPACPPPQSQPSPPPPHMRMTVWMGSASTSQVLSRSAATRPASSCSLLQQRKQEGDRQEGWWICRLAAQLLMPLGKQAGSLQGKRPSHVCKRPHPPT
jgi:hypothetical protein